MDITQKCINNLRNFLQKLAIDKIAIAVSGGSDSIFLLSVISDWAKKNNIECVILTVNHNLRAASNADIEFVKEIADKLGHKVLALCWEHDQITSGIQEKARKARYELMTEACHKLNTKTLLTAHHLDDTIETYLMRKERNSSIFGLSTMRTNFINDVMVIRPLHNIYKSDIIAYLQKNNIAWREDSSNQLDIYERNRVRKYIATLTQEEKTEILQEIKINDQEREVLNELLIEAIAESIKISDLGYAIIDIEKFLQYELQIQIQIIFYITAVISGKNTIARYRNIHRIPEAICNNKLTKITLHHCVLHKLEGKLFVYKEKSTIQTDVSYLSASNYTKNNNNNLHIYWDNRFQITTSLDIENLHISTLDHDEYKVIADMIDLRELTFSTQKLYKEILFTIPVIKNLEKILAIPNISYYDDEALADNIKVIFKPHFISRFTHFF